MNFFPVIKLVIYKTKNGLSFIIVLFLIPSLISSIVSILSKVTLGTAGTYQYLGSIEVTPTEFNINLIGSNLFLSVNAYNNIN